MKNRIITTIIIVVSVLLLMVLNAPIKSNHKISFAFDNDIVDSLKNTQASLLVPDFDSLIVVFPEYYCEMFTEYYLALDNKTFEKDLKTKRIKVVDTSIVNTIAWSTTRGEMLPEYCGPDVRLLALFYNESECDTMSLAGYPSLIQEFKKMRYANTDTYWMILGCISKNNQKWWEDFSKACGDMYEKIPDIDEIKKKNSNIRFGLKSGTKDVWKNNIVNVIPIVITALAPALSVINIEALKYRFRKEEDNESFIMSDIDINNTLVFDEPYISTPILESEKYFSLLDEAGRSAKIYNNKYFLDRDEGYYIVFDPFLDINRIADFCYYMGDNAIYKIKKRIAKKGFRTYLVYNRSMMPYVEKDVIFEGYQALYSVKVHFWYLDRKQIRHWISRDIFEYQHSFYDLWKHIRLYKDSFHYPKYKNSVPEFISLNDRIHFVGLFRFIRDRIQQNPILLPDFYFSEIQDNNFPPIRVESETDAFTETGINVHGYDVYEDPGFDINDYQLRLTRSEENKLEYVGTLVKRQN